LQRTQRMGTRELVRYRLVRSMEPGATRSEKINPVRPPRPGWIARERAGADRAVLFLIFLYQFSASFAFLWTPYGFAPSLYGLWGLISAFGLGFTGIRSRVIALLWHICLSVLVLTAPTHPGNSAYTEALRWVLPSLVAGFYLGLSAFLLYRRSNRGVAAREADQSNLPQSDSSFLDPNAKPQGLPVGPLAAADRVILIAICWDKSICQWVCSG